MAVLTALCITLVCVALAAVLAQALASDPLRSIPGPRLYTLASCRLAYDEFAGCATKTIHCLHQAYGPVVRLSPGHVSFNSASALKTIYGVGSRSQRTSVYRMFEPYGVPTMFTMGTSDQHNSRKKTLVRAYAKSNMVAGEIAQLIEDRATWFLDLVMRSTLDEEVGINIAEALHFFSLDVSSAFIYGSSFATAALKGGPDRQLLDDFHHPLRRKLAWAAAHNLPHWLVAAFLCAWKGLLGQPTRPLPFSRVRAHGQTTFAKYRDHVEQDKENSSGQISLISCLWKHRSSLKDIDIQSECADHLLAGIETTRNSLIFLIWSLSLPQHAEMQQRLQDEVRSLTTRQSTHGHWMPAVEGCDDLPYLRAVLKETLRLYAALPKAQPRSFESDIIIDGYAIPAKTIVSASPYSVHRDPNVFPFPHEFRPERWLDSNAEMNRMWWPFSSGGRTCTGIQLNPLSSLAMAQMSTLTAAIYLNYTTSIAERFRDLSPAVTSRDEVFWDGHFSERYEEDMCPIVFRQMAR